NHAHTKAIIHRDIKAGNVLAYLHDGKPVVKVIDFGIAKALTGDKLTEQTFNTERGQVIGTYETMSPEQAEGSPDIDTRTDVYSLGVLLYELLSGTKPFDETLRKATDHEIKRIIREVEPPRPSTKLSGLGEEATRIATARREKVESLADQLKVELEWIPLKALRKERDRRYASPLQLSEDIQNYIEHKPLLAGPESKVYRLKKFTRRNKIPITAAASFIVLLTAGVVFYIHSIRAEQRKTEAALLEAQRQKDQATNQSKIAKAVSKFLTERVIAAATPEVIPDKAARDVIVKAMLDPAAANVTQDFKDDPLTEAAVRESLAMSYHSIGRTDLAMPHIETALGQRRRVEGNDHPDTIHAIILAGVLMNAYGKITDAESLLREGLQRGRRVLSPDDQDLFAAMNTLGYVMFQQGRIDEAELLYREGLEGRRRVLGSDDTSTLASLSSMAFLMVEKKKLNDAEAMFRECLDRRRRTLGDDHPHTLASMTYMGSVLRAQGKLDEAEVLLRESLERSRRVLGENHKGTINATADLAALCETRGRVSEAETLYRDAVTRAKANPSMGPLHPWTQRYATSHARWLDAVGRHDDADALRQEFGLKMPATAPATQP
ncbi:MAG: tetratricopeptide repeat protein, partial [Tepidisphaeraceae bacterium]